jgi:hypothetical protein
VGESRANRQTSKAANKPLSGEELLIAELWVVLMVALLKSNDYVSSRYPLCISNNA